MPVRSSVAMTTTAARALAALVLVTAAAAAAAVADDGCRSVPFSLHPFRFLSSLGVLLLRTGEQRFRGAAGFVRISILLALQVRAFWRHGDSLVFYSTPFFYCCKPVTRVLT